MRPVSRLFATLLVLAACAAAPALAADYSLVRVHFDGADGGAILARFPELDVAAVKPGVSAEIVLTPDTEDALRATGLRYEVVHKDLVAHYQSRIVNKDTNFGGWHTYSENIAYLDSLRGEYPDLISAKWSIGQSHEMRHIWAVRLSDNPDVDEPGEPEILLDTMHHAREIMSGEFGILFADYLCSNYGTDPVVTWLMDNRELYIVSIVNPDGVVYNETTNPNGGGMWRKNRRYNSPGVYGVDLNRNYPFEWVGPGSSTDPSSDTYRGPSAGSEPETQALINFINSHEFVTHQSLHTYSNLTLIPWGYTSADTPDHATYVHMAEVMTMYNGYEWGQAPDLLYSVNGITNDWAYADGQGHERMFSFCNEIGTTGFWPSFSERDALFQDNVWPMLYLMMSAGAYPDVQELGVTDAAGGALDPGDNGLLNLRAVNQGVTESLSGLTITVSCDDPYVQFTEAQRTVGLLLPMGQSGMPALPFTVDASCPDGHLVTVDITADFSGGSLPMQVSFMVGAPSTVFSDDFSSGTGSWTLSGGPWGVSSTAHSAPYSLTDTPSGDYSNNVTATATINGQFAATQLSFWHRYEIESGWDYGRVQVMPNGGAWSTVTSYTGTQSSWQQVTLDLSGYAQPVQVRFVLETDYSVTYDGWYIDDVMLMGAGTENQLPAAPALIAPAAGAITGDPVQLTVGNSSDPEGDDVSYGFRVYGDALMTEVVAGADDVVEGAGGQTSWTTPALGLGTYWWRAYAADSAERGLLGEARSFTVGTSTGVDGVLVGPRLNVIGQGGDRAELQLSLDRGADVQVKIYNARGQLVRDLFGGAVDAGSRVLVWDGRDADGRPAASGVYFVRAELADEVLRGRVVMVR
jgi:carboxypeptidase T